MKNENVNMMLEGIPQNLSDFALFQSVMKRKEAHEIVLSIIMEDPGLILNEIHVEEVILNKCQKRAIRLDAWAKDLHGIQYNTEMQNDTRKDDMRKRARFYQSLIDSPILKSGQETKYKHLPETVVIFITQEDIFGEDLVKYTFTEQCEEVEGLHLEDGTTKIFLNMTSKNGTPELVSLLQYMKEITLENPLVFVKDARMERLDSIVTEVKESEEWEEVYMSIYSVGIDVGEESRLLKLICKKLRKGKSEEIIADEVEEDISFVQKMIDFVMRFAPKYDEDAVLSAWMQVRDQVNH